MVATTSRPASQALLPGFANYGVEANAVFRTCLDAMARPGTIHAIETGLRAPPPLSPVAAAVILSLADFETSIWLDDALAADAAVGAFLRFHTGAQLVATPGDADFAVVGDVAAMPDIAAFKQGTPEFPDRSTTIILQVEQLLAQGFRFRGPGILSEIAFSAAPLPAGFADALRGNRAAFPCGVDFVFTTPAQLAALPRSVHVVSGG